MLAEPGTYDYLITVFSPEGRLLQVEYALEAVRQGSTIIGLSCAEGVVIGAEERTESRLLDPNFSQKIYEIDEHVGAAVVGMSSDARRLVNEARLYAQSNRLMYDELIDVKIVTKRIGDIMQLYTQHAGARPFGVSIIFGGVDRAGPRVLMTDPGGSCSAYKAVAIGIGGEAAEKLLNEEYREDLKIDEAAGLAVKCLVEGFEKRREDRGEDSQEKVAVRMATIPCETRRFRMLTAEEVESYIRGCKRGGRGSPVENRATLTGKRKRSKRVTARKSS
jgi:proteasome alpha subunit